MAGATLTQAALQSSQVKIGTNGKFYFDLTNHVNGNGAYKIAARLGKVGELGGPPLLAFSIVIDGAATLNNQEDPSDFLINSGMGLVMLDFPMGTAIGAGYFLGQINGPVSGGSTSTPLGNAYSGYGFYP